MCQNRGNLGNLFKNSGENSRFYHAFKQEDFVGRLSELAACCQKPKLEQALLPRFYLGFLDSILKIKKMKPSIAKPSKCRTSMSLSWFSGYTSTMSTWRLTRSWVRWWTQVAAKTACGKKRRVRFGSWGRIPAEEVFGPEHVLRK